jgi:TonB dependent receptor-like, beta-barrel
VVGRWVVGQWEARPGWTLRASTGTAYQFAPPAWLRYAGGTTAAPEEATYADAGIEHRLSPTVTWRTTLYFRRERDVLRGIDPTPRYVGATLLEPTFETALERWTGRSRGVELQIRRASDLGLAGWLAYSFGVARYHDPVRNETFWADNDQRHTFTGFGIYRFSKRLQLSARLRIGSNFPVPGYLDSDGGLWQFGPSRNALRLPLYSRLDLRVDRTFLIGSRRVTLFGELINALDHANLGSRHGVVPPPSNTTAVVEPLYPRLPSVGVRVDW